MSAHDMLLAAAGVPTTLGLAVRDVFSADAYTGTGAALTITNGLNLSGEGGLVWGKQRVGMASHWLADTVRGANSILATNASTKANAYAGSLTSFNSDGFSIGDSSVTNLVTNYIAWSFRKAPKFFDVVTYTGDALADHQIPHSLGCAPGLILAKSTSGTGGWAVYHRAKGAGYYALLNSTSAFVSSTAWSSTEPTDAHFTVGGSTVANSPGSEYVAYLFAHDTASDGVIQCGSYAGNGSTTGPEIALGWVPQFLFLMRSDGTGSRLMFDTARGIVTGGAEPSVSAEASSQETSAEYLSLTSSGFQIASTSANVNTLNSVYCYLAIRSE